VERGGQTMIRQIVLPRFGILEEEARIKAAATKLGRQLKAGRRRLAEDHLSGGRSADAG
jgi:hypothetical protein